MLARTLAAFLVLGGTIVAFQNEPVVEWIRAQAIPLRTVEAGNGFADMQPLKKIVGDARIVALGEATHGTREFFQLKHRMLEFLAEEMGFSIFSIEANMPEAYRLNDYVLTGRGDPAALLRGMYFWTWDTQEVLEMIRWMRAFNESGKGRVQFTGFDMQIPEVAMQIASDFVAKHDPDYSPVVRQAAALAAASNNSAAVGFGVATGTFPVADAAGKRVRYSGYIKTQGITRGYAGLWWRVDGESGVLAFDNMAGRGVTGTSEWKRYQIELPVAADATNINFGAILTGDGTAWFDGLSVELDGVSYTNTALFDLGFESAGPRGFFTGGSGYQVQLDRAAAQSGGQSLRMRLLSPAPVNTGGNPRQASASWKEVVGHMEASRAAYTRAGVTRSDVDWAIQNARVVLQAMQLRANEVPRDESMARNVQWILDQNPRAKIVLWAHNGHVATGGFRGYEPMGGALRRMYGGQMVVFGFAFHQGSFQAIETGQGLRDFTVPAGPAEGLDATFAAAGFPVFALDLRRIPAGAVAQWFRQPRLSRNIGAVYSEEAGQQFFSPVNAPETFDAMLFVEKTTAARKN
jgi:erythromycin esterase-like protein